MTTTAATISTTVWSILNSRASAASAARRAAAPKPQRAADVIADAKKALAIAPKPATTAAAAKPVKFDRDRQIRRALASAIPDGELVALLKGPVHVLEAALAKVGA